MPRVRLARGEEVTAKPNQNGLTSRSLPPNRKSLKGATFARSVHVPFSNYSVVVADLVQEPCRVVGARLFSLAA